MSKIIKKNKMKYGYAILELLFYLAFLSILALLVINAMITMARSFRETSIQAELVQSGNIMERISREIRTAKDINSISTNDLVLNMGASNIKEFKLLGTNIQLIENSTFTGNLNASNITVTALTFTQITSTKGKAVKISLTVQANDDLSGRLVNLYDTVVLRGSYQN